MEWLQAPHFSLSHLSLSLSSLFFFNDTATTEIYTLSLHDAFRSPKEPEEIADLLTRAGVETKGIETRGAKIDQVFVSQIDRKSTRLNSSHITISYAVFCLKKKKKTKSIRHQNIE